MIHWIQAWLVNRMAWVKVEGVRSRSRLFRQGLPQGSVLSPLLFVVYVNDLVQRLSERVNVSSFANDLAVWQSARNVDVCSEKLQWAADCVYNWCNDWCMKLAVGSVLLLCFLRT